ncbi:hypothetical protein HN385_04525 [archaeon]|jgi:hypothetical protein|nr:hypothetical protein [archaeon]MBT3450858.1 hypothetical protein [archaeon]MBT6868735.1 hypothetical protein [archaeon]MBT7192360.1 hypothetical protein [archaeon]MBT7381189.1 hypothetical protein [archaeon]
MVNEYIEQKEFLIGQLERMMVTKLPKDSYKFGDSNFQIFVNNADYFDNIAFAFGVKQMYNEKSDLNFTLNLIDLESSLSGGNKKVPVWVYLKDENNTFYDKYQSFYRIPGHNEGI